MRKHLFTVLAALAAGVAQAFTPQAYTNSFERGGVTYVQRGGLGTKDYVVTNVDVSAFVSGVSSVNSKTGAVVLVASDVQALPDNYTALTNNSNFKTAVEKVSPPVSLPQKWALANVTNYYGGVVTARDINALPATYESHYYEVGNVVKFIGDIETKSSVSMSYPFEGYGEDFFSIMYGEYGPRGALLKGIGTRKWYYGNDETPENEIATVGCITAENAGALPDNYASLKTNENFICSVSNVVENADIVIPNAKMLVRNRGDEDDDYASISSTAVGQKPRIRMYSGAHPEQWCAYLSDLDGYISKWSKFTVVEGDDKTIFYNKEKAGYPVRSFKFVYEPDGVLSPVGSTLIPDGTDVLTLGKMSNAVISIVSGSTLHDGFTATNGIKRGSFKIDEVNVGATLNGATQYARLMMKYDKKPQLGYFRQKSGEATLDYDYILPMRSGTIALNSYHSLYDMLEDAATNETAVASRQAMSHDICCLASEEITNTVNAVKAEFYDEPLQVNWTMRMVNGEMKLYATTNVNMSTL